MRSSRSMWEPTWVSRSRCWLLPESRLGHVYVSPEPVGSTHLRFGDARVVEILVCGNPKVVRSPGCDPGRHEVFRNGPEVKIYIWEVLFWSPEKFRTLSVLYRECRKGSGGPPAPGATWAVGGAPWPIWAKGTSPKRPMRQEIRKRESPKGGRHLRGALGGKDSSLAAPFLGGRAKAAPPLSLGPIYSGGKGGQQHLSPGASLSLP